MRTKTLKVDTRPAYVPSGAEQLTLGELADRGMDLGKGRDRAHLRIAFRLHGHDTAGPLLHIERGPDARGGNLHLARGWRGRKVSFDESPTLMDRTTCWIWTADDEKREAIQGSTLYKATLPAFAARTTLN